MPRVRLHEVAATLAALACFAAASAETPSSSRPSLPYLASPDIKWRVDGIELEPAVAADASSTFSPDGRYVAVSSPSSIRVLDVNDGRAVEQLRAETPQRLSYSLAIANTGRVSLGRPGSRQVYEVGSALPIVIFPCQAPGCAPVSLAFSPDDAVLAFHEIEPRPAEPTLLGAVVIVDLVFGETTRISASTGLRQTVFAAPRARSRSRSRSAAEPPGEVDAAAFELWRTADERLPRSMLGRGWTVGTVSRDARAQPTGMVAVYGSGSTLVMRDFADDRLVWAAPLVPPALAPAGTDVHLSRAAHVELSPDGRFVIGYEIPLTTDRETAAAGAIVVRRARDGAVVEAYDVAGVADLAIAPDSRSFVYTTATTRPETALVAVPDL